MKGIFAVLLMLGTYSLSYTQTVKKIGFGETDRDTYRFFIGQQWDSLIITGQQALEANVDYFYLRLRMGIAYYNLENYMLAAHHLNKALQFNHSDKTTKEYLYFANKLINRTENAAKIYGGFSKQIRKQVDPHKTSGYAILEVGQVFSNNIAKNDLKQQGRQAYYSEQDLYGDIFYRQAGAGVEIIPGISAYAGYNKLTIDKLREFRTSELVKTGDTGILVGNEIVQYNLYDTENQISSFPYKLYQDGLYLQAKLASVSGFLVSFAFHHLWIESTLWRAVPEAFYAQSFDTIPVNRFDIAESNLSLTNSVYSVAVNKPIRNFYPGFEASWSDLNYDEQYQLTGKLYWYPSGNLNSYLGAAVTWAGSGDEGNPVYHFIAGIKIMKPIWLEADITSGHMLNFNESNGYVVYNSGDVMKLKAGSNIFVTLSQRIEFFARYRILQYETERINLHPNGLTNIQKLTYNNHSIMGGIQWKF
ncbi:MAG: hypothetical protein KDC05_03595 [Bacteroidales bacterium]|nr:hypothetical protein [Bacteroidales bacterium]